MNYNQDSGDPALKTFFNPFLKGFFLKSSKGVETLSILNDLSMAMSRAAEPQELVEKLVDRSMRAVNAEQARMATRDLDPTPEVLEGLRRSALDLLVSSELVVQAARAEGLAAAHPHRERLQAQRIVALYRSGRQANHQR